MPDQCPDPHLAGNGYSWGRSQNGLRDGAAFNNFLFKLNSGTGFAGHTDWRLLTVAGLTNAMTYERPELESLYDNSVAGCGPGVAPCIAPIFAPTYFVAPSGSLYWSSSVVSNVVALYFDFATGQNSAIFNNAYSGIHVRAVRGRMW